MELTHTTLSVSLAGLMSLAPLASGQEIGDQVVLDVVERARALQRVGEHEAAAIELLRARSLVDRRADGGGSASLRKDLDAILADADPRFKKAQRTRESIAKKMLALAKSYRGRGWWQLELAVLRQSQAMNVQVPARQLVSLERLKPGVFDTEEYLGLVNPSLSEPTDQIEDFDDPVSPWKFLDGVLSSPSLSTDSALVVSDRLTHESSVISVEVNRPAEPSQASLVVGAQSRDDFFIFDVQYFESTTAVATVWRWFNGAIETIGTEEFLLSEREKQSWVPYEVQIDGTRATFVVAGRNVLSVDCPREPYGRVGFFISQTSAYKNSVGFRRLYLRERIATKDAQAAADEVRGLIADAARLVEQNRDEEACMKLIKARNLIGGLTDVSVRAELANSVIESRSKADPLAERHLQLDLSTGEGLLEIADAYTQAEWHRLAREYILQAAQYDLASAADQLAANEIAVQLLFADAQGWPAEAPRPVDNAKLVELFQDGEQPLDGTKVWVVDESGATAPSDRYENSMILSRVALGGGEGFSIQVLSGAVDRSFGLHFGFDESQTDHLLRFHHSMSAGWTRVEFLYRKNGGRYMELNSKNIRFRPEALAEWMTIHVEFERSLVKVKVRVGREPEFSMRTQDAYPQGQIALRSKHVEGQPPLRFRNLTVKED